MWRGTWLVLVLGMAGCGGRTAASAIARPPEFNPEGETKCGVVKSRAKPLIVEWPSADRAELEALLKARVVVVDYRGCKMRILSRCSGPGAYSYTPVTPKTDTVWIRNEDELWAAFLGGAVGLEAELKRAGQLDVQTTMVGRYAIASDAIDFTDLEGECGGATHVITGITVGAFEFSAGAAAEVGGSAMAMGTGAGARSSARRKTITKDGDIRACDNLSPSGPPERCGGLIRVEVLPLAGSERATRNATGEVTCPPGTTWSGSACVAPRGKRIASCADREACLKEAVR